MAVKINLPPTIGQVNTAVGEIDRVTQQNAAMVEETSAATHALASEATQLVALVRTFRTRDLEARAARGNASLRQSSLVDGSAGHRPTHPKAAQPAAPTPRAPQVVGNLALAPSKDEWSEF